MGAGCGEDGRGVNAGGDDGRGSWADGGWLEGDGGGSSSLVAFSFEGAGWGCWTGVAWLAAAFVVVEAGVEREDLDDEKKGILVDNACPMLRRVTTSGLSTG